VEHNNMEAIIQQLKTAAAAYYNTDTPLMSDDAYDALVETLRELAPDHPLLNTVGAAPASAATLPYRMCSLEKVKPGTPGLTRFLAAGTAAGAFILSEKLDGISALWISGQKRLFLRGDDRVGTDVSALAARGIQGLPVVPGVVVRGELIVPRATFVGGKLVRNWVNGILHRDEAADADIQTIRFVAYELIEPVGLSRAQQMVRMKSLGFETVWWNRVDHCTEEVLKATFTNRRRDSVYETDGIVVAQNVPVPSSRSRPLDMMAFKMPVDNEIVRTRVVAVLWAISSQGYIIPRVQIEPVEIHGARIEFCSAHNAKFVETARIGAGAVVEIRRSGDVIPTIHSVVTPAVAAMPTGGWEWDATHTHAKTTEDGSELRTALMTHFVKTLEIDGCGEGQMKKLVEAGMTLVKMIRASSGELQAILGKKTGESLAEQLRTRVAAASEKTLMVASRLMPRTVGETKLTGLFSAEADPRRWGGLSAVAGWSKESLHALLAVMPAYELWRQDVVSMPAYPILPAPAGFGVSDTVTRKTTILVAADLRTQKAQKAREAGVEILGREEFVGKYLT
jgi:NAD-dependent DNA ligase